MTKQRLEELRKLYKGTNVRPNSIIADVNELFAEIDRQVVLGKRLYRALACVVKDDIEHLSELPDIKPEMLYVRERKLLEDAKEYASVLENEEWDSE